MIIPGRWTRSQDVKVLSTKAGQMQCKIPRSGEHNTKQQKLDTKVNPVNQRGKKLEVMENALEVAVGQIAVILCFGSINKQNARRTQSK